MYDESIIKAQSLLQDTDDKAHDITHAHRVAENALLLGRKLDYPDVELLVLCGWWHDVGRMINNDGHEQISATMLKKDLLERGFSNDVAENAYQAVVYHKWNMQPKTEAGLIIRDADKLDFISTERWRACLDAGQLGHLQDIKVLLPKLRTMLTFAESKDLYDQRIHNFMSSRLVDLLL